MRNDIANNSDPDQGFLNGVRLQRYKLSTDQSRSMIWMLSVSVISSRRTLCLTPTEDYAPYIESNPAD